MKTVLGTVALTALLALTGSAKATAGEYGSFKVENPYSKAINYEVKWGDGEWTTYRVGPYSSRWHAHPLDVYGGAPVPSVRFDWILGDDETSYRTYRVDFYEVSRGTDGKPYVFRASPGGGYLYLYAK